MIGESFLKFCNETLICVLNESATGPFPVQNLTENSFNLSAPDPDPYRDYFLLPKQRSFPRIRKSVKRLD